MCKDAGTSDVRLDHFLHRRSHFFIGYDQELAQVSLSE